MANEDDDFGLYNILCRVSGGVTGTREALLKADGRVVVFEGRAAAQAEADRLNAARRGSVASFSYTVIEA